MITTAKIIKMLAILFMKVQIIQQQHSDKDQQEEEEEMSNSFQQDIQFPLLPIVLYMVHQNSPIYIFQVSYLDTDPRFQNLISLQAILNIKSDQILDSEILFLYKQGEFGNINDYNCKNSQNIKADQVDYNGQFYLKLNIIFFSCYYQKHLLYIIFDTNNPTFDDQQPQYLAVIIKAGQNIDYTIQIIPSSQQQCPNNCSQNGQCMKLEDKYVCDCYPNKVDNDCSVDAIEVMLNKKISIHPDEQYLYFQPTKNWEKEIVLSITMSGTSNSIDRYILIVKSEYTGISSLPNTQEYDFQTSFSIETPVTLRIHSQTFPFMMDLERCKKILFILKPTFLNQNGAKDEIEIQISDSGEQDDDEDKESVILMVIYILIGILGGIILIGLGIYFVKRNQLTTNRGTIDENGVFTIPQRPNRRTLSEDDLNQFLPMIRFQDIHNLNEIACQICLVDYEPAQIVRQTPCQHIYHKECIELWLNQNESCPSCRFSLIREDLIIFRAVHQLGNVNIGTQQIQLLVSNQASIERDQGQPAQDVIQNQQSQV